MTSIDLIISFTALMVSDLTGETQTNVCVFKVPVKTGGKKVRSSASTKDAFVSCEVLTTYHQCYPITAFALWCVFYLWLYF